MQSYNLDDEIRKYSSQLMQQYNSRPKKAIVQKEVPKTNLSKEVPKTNLSAEKNKNEEYIKLEHSKPDLTSKKVTANTSQVLKIEKESGIEKGNLVAAMANYTVPTPVKPEEILPEVTVPTPVKPEETMPEVAVPTPVKPEETMPEVAVPTPVKPEETMPEVTVPTPVKPEEIIPEVTVPTPVKPEEIIPKAAVPTPDVTTPQRDSVENNDTEQPLQIKKEPLERLQKTPEEQYEALLQQYPQRGFIKVQTLTARGAYPVADATVIISKVFDNGEYVISRQRTDAAGQINPVEVPAMDKELSERPGNPNPYITYKLVVTHPDTASVISDNVPVFSGITSVQVVNLVPTSTIPSGEEFIDNQEPTDL